MLIAVQRRSDISTYIWGARYGPVGKRYTARVGGVTYENDDDVGKKVCISGIITHVECGKMDEIRDEWRVLERTRDGGYRPTYFRSLRFLNFDCALGDSGAPVYVNEVKHAHHLVNAIGIVQGFVATSLEDKSGPCIFSHIGHAINDMEQKAGIRDLNLVLTQGGDGDMRKGRG